MMKPTYQVYTKENTVWDALQLKIGDLISIEFCEDKYFKCLIIGYNPRNGYIKIWVLKPPFFIPMSSQFHNISGYASTVKLLVRG